MHRTSPPIPAIRSAIPTRSGKPPSSGWRTSGTNRRDASSATAIEREVDEEDQPPADLHEQAPERRPARCGDGADGGPRADRAGACRGREHRQQEAQRRRQYQRGADRLDGAGRGQRPGSRRRCAAGGPGGEDHEPEVEGAAPPEQVPEAPGRDQAGREHDRVGAEHPRQRLVRGAGEVALDRREGHVDDEQVQLRHERADRDHAEGHASMDLRFRQRTHKSFHSTHARIGACCLAPTARRTARSRRDWRSSASAGRC